MINLSTKKILVTGGNGFIGTSVVNNLVKMRGVPRENIIVPRSKEHDLRDYKVCEDLLRDNHVDLVIHLATLIGGVGYSSKYPATQYYNNILVDLQVTEAAKNVGVEKIVLVSSACAYPKEAKYPLKEEYLWDGLPQETNLAYGIAKRIMTVQGPAYRQEFGLNAVVVVPNNSYGPGDNFHPDNSHVIPSLIRRCLAQEDPLIVWGDGTPTRDFLYVDDFAEGIVAAAERLESDEIINLGTGIETPVSELIAKIRELTQHTGEVVFDATKPNGQPRRSVDVSKAKSLIGFTAEVSLEDGLKKTIEWYRSQNN